MGRKSGFAKLDSAQIGVKKCCGAAIERHVF
jgi:hypothetical protein